MGRYALVEDGKITDGPRSLPKRWRNVSGLHLATDAELKEKESMDVGKNHSKILNRSYFAEK